MKRLLLILTIIITLASCRRNNQLDNKPDYDGPTSIVFMQGKVRTDLPSKAAAAAEAIAVDTTFRVKVFAAGADPKTDAEVTQKTYRITTTSTETAAVKANGQYDPTGTKPTSMTLDGRKSYDFYYFSPAIAITDMAVTNLTNGVDYMTLKESYEVEVNNISDYSFDVPEVIFNRIATRVDFAIAPPTGTTTVQTLEIESDGIKVTGLANSGEYDLMNPVTGITTTGNTAEVTVPKSYFTTTTTPTVEMSTVKHATGVLILPIANHPLVVTAKIKINGISNDFTVNIPTEQTFEGGKRYLVTIQIDKSGVVAVKVKGTPWQNAPDLADEGYIEPVIGEFRDGGVVFWIDPTNPTEYKVVDINERSGINWADANDYAAKLGKGWRLPDLDETATLVANVADVNKAIDNFFGIQITDALYWSSVNIDQTAKAVNLITGAEYTPAKVDLQKAKAVKTVILVVDYTDFPANTYVSYPKHGQLQGVVFNALKKPIAKYSKGNSTIVNVTGLNPATAESSLSDDIVYQAGDNLEVVWQTAVNLGAVGGEDNMVVKSLALDEKGIATVRIRGVGNAVIAYKRGSDILWTYQIWATDSNPFVKHYATGNNVNGQTKAGVNAQFMDRNLGALAATATKPSTAFAFKYYSLLYQHGRSTPFTGQGATTVIDTHTVIFDAVGNNIDSSIGGFVASNTAVSSVDAAIKTPMTYYSQNVPNWSWYKFADVALWSSYGANKSIYDPCPYGYRVPADGSWAGLKVLPAGQSLAIDAGSIWNNTWWPATGRRDTSNGKILWVGYSYYWSSTRSSAYAGRFMYFEYGGKSTNTSNSAGFSHAMAVRCVEEGY